MGKELTTEKLKNPLTIRALVVGVIISIVASIISVFGLGFGSVIDIALSFADRMIFTMIILVILSLFINPLLKARGFSSGELIVIYVMTMTTVIGHKSWGGIMYNLAAFQSTFSTTALQFTPDIWIPTDPTVWQPMLQGGVAVPWAEWIAPLAYWIILQLSFIGIGMSFGLILRHSIIDVERLPFPYTQIIAPLTAESKKPLKERINITLLLVGFLIGFIIQGTYGFFQRVIPGFPDFWPKGIWGTVGYDLGPILGPDVARNQNLVISLGSLPSLFALFFVVPTKILGSALLIHFLIANVFAYIEVGMGMITNISAFGLYDIIGWALYMFGTFFETTGIQWFTLTGIGFPIGFIIAYIFFVRKEIAASLKDALGRSRKESILWITFVVSIVLYVALISWVGIPLVVALLFVFYSFVFLIIAVRMRGEAVMDIPPVLHTFFDSAFLASGGVDSSREAYLSGMMFGLVQSQGFCFARTPAYMPLEGIRLLEMSGEKWRWRSTVIATAIAIVITAIINWTSYLWGVYTYGQIVRWNVPEWSRMSGDVSDILSSVLTPGSYAMGIAPVRIWPETIIGIIVAVVITILNSLFIWWPIHPLGLIIGPYLGWALWFPVLLAFIARIIVIKLGGAKLYNKAIQVVLGLLLGYAVIQVFYFVTLLF